VLAPQESGPEDSTAGDRVEDFGDEEPADKKDKPASKK
jgi:hypothetical protein